MSKFATAVQGTASALLDFSVGSILRAVAEATAGVTLWLQAMILQVLTLTRASTSAGADLDSWMADFSFPRLPASASVGLVTFARFTTGQQALIPVGAVVRTADGLQAYTVTASTAHAVWDATLNGYDLLAGTASVSIPVAASVAGSSGNALANTVTVLSTPIPGVDTVTNASAFTGGLDAESDSAFRARFVLYLASLSKATKAAIGAAILGLQQGLQYTLLENVDATGATVYGMFVVTVDDSSGSPSAGLLASAAAAVEAVRPVGSRFAVFAPTVLTAAVFMTITTAAGYTHGNVVGAVGIALANFVNTLPLGTTLPYTQLAAVAYAVPGVTNVSAVLLNAGTGDVTATPRQVIKSGVITVA